MRAGKEGGEGKVYVDIGNRDPGESGKVLERRKGMKGIGERERKKNTYGIGIGEEERRRTLKERQYHSYRELHHKKE